MLHIDSLPNKVKEHIVLNLIKQGDTLRDIGQIAQANKSLHNLMSTLSFASKAKSLIAANSAEHNLRSCLWPTNSPIQTMSHKAYTPLIHAVSYENAQCVQALIARGADVNMSDSKGITPLMYSLTNSSPEKSCIIQMLITAGAHINAQDACGLTPLMHAIKAAQLSAAYRLLANGANIFIRCNNRKNVLYYMRSLSNAHYLEYFITTLFDVKRHKTMRQTIMYLLNSKDISLLIQDERFIVQLKLLIMQKGQIDALLDFLSCVAEYKILQ